MAGALATIRGRWLGGLRFRLTLTYFVFITLLLSFLGIFFRQTIRALYDQQLPRFWTRNGSQFAAICGWKSPNGQDSRHRSTGTTIATTLKKPSSGGSPAAALPLADAAGHYLEVGPKYRDLAVESPEQIRSAIKSRESRWHIRKNAAGMDFLIRARRRVSEDDKPFYISIGRS